MRTFPITYKLTGSFVFYVQQVQLTRRGDALCYYSCLRVYAIHSVLIYCDVMKEHIIFIY